MKWFSFYLIFILFVRLEAAPRGTEWSLWMVLGPQTDFFRDIRGANLDRSHSLTPFLSQMLFLWGPWGGGSQDNTLLLLLLILWLNVLQKNQGKTFPLNLATSPCLAEEQFQLLFCYQINEKCRTSWMSFTVPALLLSFFYSIPSLFIFCWYKMGLFA